jgi:hypothetical protein
VRASTDEPGARGLTEQLRVEIVVRPDGSLDVTESARIRPPAGGVVQRRIVTNRNPEALGLFSELFNFFARVRVVGVTVDDRRAAFSQRGRRFDHEVLVEAPPSCSPSCTLVLRYRFRGAIGFFEHDDELAWRIGGTDWNTPIEGLSVRVQFPAGTTGLRVSEALTSGYQIAQQEARSSHTADAVDAASGHPLQLFEYLHLRLNWNKGVVDAPSLDDLIVLFLRSNWPLLIPLALSGLMYVWWRQRGRDPQRLPIPPRYEPPADLSPAEAGTLVDNSVDPRDVLATVVDLVARGHVRVQAREASQAGSVPEPGELSLVRGTAVDCHSRLLLHERVLLGCMFGDGKRTTVPASDLGLVTPSVLVRFGNAVFRGLRERGHYVRRPDLVKASYQAVGLLVALAGVPAREIFYRWFGTNDSVTLAAGILSGVVLVAWGRYMPVRTLAGARACEAVLGLGEFLARVEAERLARLRKTPGELQRLLPYAIALGVTSGWTDTHAAAPGEDRPPEPRTGGGGSDVLRFMGSLALLLPTGDAGVSAGRRTFRSSPPRRR